MWYPDTIRKVQACPARRVDDLRPALLQQALRYRHDGQGRTDS